MPRGEQSQPKKLAPDLLAFLRRAQKILEDIGEPATEDGSQAGEVGQRQEIAESIISQVIGSEVHCARHVFGSLVIQSAMKFASAQMQAKMASAVLRGEHLLVLLTDKYGSHVAEAALVHAAQIHASDDTESSANASHSRLLLPVVADRLLQDEGKALLEAMHDRYGTHVLRVLLRLLSGRSATPPAAGRRSATGGRAAEHADAFAEQPTPVPAEYSDALCKVAGLLSGFKARRLLELSTRPSTSATLQTLLLVLPAGGTAVQQLSSRLLQWDEDADSAPNRAQAKDHVLNLSLDQSASHLIEFLLRLRTLNWWRPLYLHCFRGELARLAAHERGNYVVQALVSTASDGRSHSALLKELLPSVSTLLFTRTELVCGLVQGCARFGGGRDLVREIRAAAGAAEKGDGLACALLGLRAAGETGENPGRASMSASGLTLTTAGSKLVQALCTLPSNCCEAVMLSLSMMSESAVLEMCVSPPGSRVMEAALKADGAHRPKAKLLKLVIGHAARLACERCGSFVVEAAFDTSNVDEKSAIVEAIASVEATMRASSHGNHLIKKVRLTHWRQHRDSWRSRELKGVTAHQTFAELLREDDAVAQRGATNRSEPKHKLPSRSEDEPRGVGSAPSYGRDAKRGGNPAAAMGAEHASEDQAAHEQQELMQLFDLPGSKPGQAMHKPRMKKPRKWRETTEAPITTKSASHQNANMRQANTFEDGASSSKATKRRAVKEGTTSKTGNSWLAAALSGRGGDEVTAKKKRKFSMT